MVLPERRRQQQSGALAAGDAQEQRLPRARLGLAASAWQRDACAERHFLALAAAHGRAGRRRGRYLAAAAGADCPVRRRLRWPRRVRAAPRPVRLRAVHVGRRLLHPRRLHQSAVHLRAQRLEPVVLRRARVQARRRRDGLAGAGRAVAPLRRPASRQVPALVPWPWALPRLGLWLVVRLLRGLRRPRLRPAGGVHALPHQLQRTRRMPQGVVQVQATV